MANYVNRSDQEHPAFKKQNRKASLYHLNNTEDTLDPKRIMVKGDSTESAITDNTMTDVGGLEQFTRNALTESLNRIKENNSISQLLPDMKLALEIIIGTILSPKDMMTTTLTFSTLDNRFAEKGSTLIKHLQEYFLTSYKIKDKLEPMLWDILAYTGSYPEVILPETAIDYIINSDSNITMESLSTHGVIDRTNKRLFNLGVLGNNGNSTHEDSVLDILENVSLEGHFNSSQAIDPVVASPEFKLTVTDNFDGLKLPILKNKLARTFAQQAINNRRSFGQGLESHKDAINNYYNSGRDIEEEKNLRQLYPNRSYKNVPILRVKNKDQLGGETTGHPKVIKYASESMIPVFSPNDPKNHIGFFIAIDGTGAGLRMSTIDDLYRIVQSSSNASSTKNLSQMLMSQAQNSIMGAGGNQMDGNPQSVVPIYQAMVERDLLERLSNGVYGDGCKLGENSDIYEMMMMRAMVGKTTQLLFVEASMVSYAAVDYDDFGLGKTLFDDSKMLAAMRSLNMVTNSIANTKNAITKRTLNIELDKAEKEPSKAIAIIRNEFIKGTQAEFPITNSINDQIKYIQEAGIQVNLGEHPLLPNSKFAVDYGDNQYIKVDTEYDNWLRDAHARALGISPEIIEGAGSADFATQTVISNVLTQRRIQKLSEKFCLCLTDFVRKYTYNSQPLMEELTKLVTENKITLKGDNGRELTPEEVAYRFLETVSVSLPPPDTTSVKEQKEALMETEEFYESAIKHFVSADFISGADLGDLSEDVETIKNFLVSHYMRNWMRKNGVLPELFDMLSKKSDGSAVMDLASIRGEFMETMKALIVPAMKKSFKQSGDINAEIEDFKNSLANPPGENEGGGGSSFDTDYSTDNLDEATADGELDTDLNDAVDEKLDAEKDLDTTEKDEELKQESDEDDI